MELLFLITSRCLIKIIKIYHYFIGPLLGPCCRFNPTCSEYAINVLYEYRLIKSIWLIIKRILKCHSFNIVGCNLMSLDKQYNHREK